MTSRLLAVLTLPAVLVGAPASARQAGADEVSSTRTEPSCLARCASTRDARTGNAATKLRARDYHSKFDSNCPSADGLPNCAGTRQACWDACGPKYERACMAACEPPFQSCCHSNDTALASRGYDACVAQCPAVPLGRGADAAQPPKPPAGSLGRGVDRADPFADLNARAAALAADLQELGLQQLDDLRRAAAFMQVSLDIAVTNAKFAVVSGGAGRIWVIFRDGRQVLLDGRLAGALRGEGPSLGEALESMKDVAKATGLSGPEVDNVYMAMLAAAKRQAFGPGDVLYFPGPDGWPGHLPEWLASAEHSSIRGTINGGGDFI
jgi:hypothetical protein